MFVPTAAHVQTPANLGIEYDDVYVKTKFGSTLHGWMLKTASAQKGNIVFVHGNGENISTHVNSLAWLTRYGYDVLIYDYQGYAKSTGTPNLAQEIDNVSLMLDYAAGHSKGPTILYGQSLGGAIASSALIDTTVRSKVSMLVVESSFPNFRRIVQDKLSEIWLTWPLQWPLSFAFASNRNPEDAISQLAPIPILIVHGKRDKVVPYDNAFGFIERAGRPSALWTISDGGHTMANLCLDFRQELAKVFDTVAEGRAPELTDQSFSLPLKVVEILRARGDY